MSAVAVHPLASVIFTVSVSVVTGVTVAVLSEPTRLAPIQVYTYGADPPVTLAVRVPEPTQIIGGPLKLTLRAVGSVMLAEAELVHPWASVTVMVYVPADKPVPVAFVIPPGDHKY